MFGLFCCTSSIWVRVRGGVVIGWWGFCLSSVVVRGGFGERWGLFGVKGKGKGEGKIVWEA